SENIFTIDPSEPPSTPTVETTVPTVSTHVPTIIKSRGGLRYSQPPSISNVVSSENRVEDFFGDSTHATRLNEVEADLSNMETIIQVSPTLTLRIHKDHPKNQIIGPVDTLLCLFSAFLSQEEPKKISKALKDSSWVEAMQEELLQFQIQNPWGKDGTGKDVDLHLYRSMIGSLMYLTASRPDIMFALGLWYPKESPFDLVAYSDSDYGGASQDRKSTTGGCQFLGRRLISWQCKKQTIVATSITEAEYVAAASGCGQVLWIQN
ncbi:hypothetical protein Tco_1194221, partial [Tanacetum coccineum]